MIGRPLIAKRPAKGEAEKPFWISYADLMTALMVMFLVAMTVAMSAVTNSVKDIAVKNQKLQVTAQTLEIAAKEAEQKNAQLSAMMRKIEDSERELKKYQKTEEEIRNELLKAERDKEILKLLDEVEQAALNHQGVQVDKDQKTINFGDRARFDKGRFALTPDQAKLLRVFVPEVLKIARSNLGRKWLKQVVVEGFASPEGDYLYNLNLSMQRSQRVLCVLLAAPYPGEMPMSQPELEQIRDLFLVGGYSFNAAKLNATTGSYEESRRVELRLEFMGIGERRQSPRPSADANFGKCALDM
jgi:outer membrane protein OmpA-like peptidoglycan-associated protein